MTWCKELQVHVKSTYWCMPDVIRVHLQVLDHVLTYFKSLQLIGLQVTPAVQTWHQHQIVNAA